MLAKLLADRQHRLAFNVLEIGARPEQAEPVHDLLGVFPSSRISALELDREVCDELNDKARPGLRYYPHAVGRTEETRTLYETVHPMCASLYEPDERYADVFNDLDVMRLVSTTQIRTIALDTFVRDEGVGPVDFVKIDVQGAELDVLQGAGRTLETVLAVVTEVEFVPLYKAQPLFGDVDAHLRERGFAFHKFLGVCGRVMKGLALRGTGHHPVQMMWTDAVYTRHLMDCAELGEEQLLKLAVLLDLYGSRDAAVHLLRRYDELRKTELAPLYLTLATASGEWTQKRTGH